MSENKKFEFNGPEIDKAKGDFNYLTGKIVELWKTRPIFIKNFRTNPAVADGRWKNKDYPETASLVKDFFHELRYTPYDYCTITGVNFMIRHLDTLNQDQKEKLYEAVRDSEN
ncbi:Fc.00g099680.m01.CDS01 [Cosmosporella sp. VM-42]